MTEPGQRKEKKSETLEVRLPHETKQAFLTACREDGTTASEVVRGSIQEYLEAREQPAQQHRPRPDYARTVIAMIPQPIRKKRWLAAGAGAVAVSMFAAMPVAAAPDFKAAFDKLDKNHDGVVTVDEFMPQGDGKNMKTVIIKREETVTDGKDAKPAKPGGKPEIHADAFAYQLGDGKPGDGGAVTQNMQIRIKRDGPDDGHIQPDPKQMIFDTFDGNHDGKLTLAEYEAHQTELLTNGFKRLDANKDGFVTEAEYAKIGQPIVIHIDDGDGDTKVSEALKDVASPDKLKAEFARRDKNKDGKLSLAEYLD